MSGRVLVAVLWPTIHYNDGMDYSPSRLLSAFALVMAGVCGETLPWRTSGPLSSLMGIYFLISIAMIFAGLGLLLKRPRVGAAIGGLIGIVMQFGFVTFVLLNSQK